MFVQGGYDNWWMSRENELPIFSCKCFIGHLGPVHIYHWLGGGGEGVLAGTLGFQGERRGYQVYLFNLQHPPPPPLPPGPAPAPPRPSPPLNTQYLVTVDLFFSNICRGVIGIPCTRLRHNCIVIKRTIFSKICITMAVSVASQRRWGVTKTPALLKKRIP